MLCWQSSCLCTCSSHGNVLPHTSRRHPCQHHTHAPFADALPLCPCAWTLQDSAGSCDAAVDGPSCYITSSKLIGPQCYSGGHVRLCQVQLFTIYRLYANIINHCREKWCSNNECSFKNPKQNSFNICLALYLAGKFLVKCCSPLWKALYQQRRKHNVTVCATRSDNNSANHWGLDHNVFTADEAQAHNKIYGIDAFHDYRLSLSFPGGKLTYRPYTEPKCPLITTIKTMVSTNILGLS